MLFSSSMDVGLASQPDTRQDDHTPRPGQQSFVHMPQELEGLDTLAGGTRIGIATIPEGKTGLMVCQRELDNGISIYLTQPIEPVDQSIQQANLLLVACTVFSLGLLTFIVLRLSKRFTEPVRQIQRTVGEMAKLNFDTRCSVRTGELENLGADVNILADTLQDALTKLERQNVQLEKDILAQKRFIANASHELRTPLSLIKGYADEMTSGFVPNSAHKDEYIRIISDEAAKMNRLLKEMLELSRMESGTTKLQIAKLSVNEQIRFFLEKYDGYIVKNSLHVELKLGDDVLGMFDAIQFE